MQQLITIALCLSALIIAVCIGYYFGHQDGYLTAIEDSLKNK